MKKLISLLILLISLNSFATSIKFTNSSDYDVSVSIDGYERLCLSGMQITELVFSGNRRISVYDPYTGGLIGTTVAHVHSGESLRVYFHEDGFRFSSTFIHVPVTFIAHPVVYVPVVPHCAYGYYHHGRAYHSSAYHHSSRVGHTAAVHHSRPKHTAARASSPTRPAAGNFSQNQNKYPGHEGKTGTVHYQPRTTVSTRSSQGATVNQGPAERKQVPQVQKPKSSSVSVSTHQSPRPSSTRVQSSRTTTSTRR